MFHYAAFLFYISFIDNSLALKKMNVEKEHLWSVIGHYGVVPFSYFCHQF